MTSKAKKNNTRHDGGAASVALYFAMRILLVGVSVIVWLFIALNIHNGWELGRMTFAALAFVYIIVCFGFCKTLDCFNLGWARVRDLSAWYALAILFANSLMFIVLAIVSHSFNGVIWFFVGWIVQCVAGVIIILIVNNAFFRINPLQHVCAILSDNEFEKRALAKLANKTDRFVIKKVVSESSVANSDLNTLALGCNTFVVGDVRHDLRRQIVHTAFVKSKSVLFIPAVSDILFIGYKPMQVSDSLFISSRNVGLSLEQRFMKRLVDIVGSCVGLVLSAIPIAVCAIIIKKTDGGTVFYTQDRVGWSIIGQKSGAASVYALRPALSALEALSACHPRARLGVVA